MDVRQFNKNRGEASKKPTGCISRVPKPLQNPKGMKTFSGGFSKSNPEPPRTNPGFGIWTDQMSAQVGKEKVSLERKQEQKRRIAIEAIKLAEQRKLAMMKRNNNTENDWEVPVVAPVRHGSHKNSTRRVLFSLDANQPGKVVKPNFLATVIPKLPPIKETEPLEYPRGRPILKAKPFADRNSNKVVFSPPSDLMKGLKLVEPVKKRAVVRYSIKELKDLNPLQSNPKFKCIYG